MDDAGYVRLWRKITENPVWTTLEAPVLKVMLAFLLKANWKPGVWYDGRTQVDIPRGAFITSYKKMAEFCNLSVKQIRSAFRHLEKLGFAAYTRARKWTMVTVLNYEVYQTAIPKQGTNEDADQGLPRAGSGQIEGTIGAPIEERKNVRTDTCPSPDGRENQFPDLNHLGSDRLDPIPDQVLGLPQARKKSPSKNDEPWLRDEQFMAFFADEFWPAYPRRDQKKRAAKVLWKVYKQRGLDFLREEILTAVELQMRPGGRLNPTGGPQYIPMATTWLNGEEWENQALGESQPPAGRLLA
jgi:hypothetical protein